ncbi:Brix domain-containing protein [Meloidogyne graminicola]|uniref:Brix domain-containing protein n=1 Tax=Meloidogyne graminicola TaxID=189291 RepID=A0A8S9ZML6_9BILA|nr:Brix domain-containing protein [Meloidogyne graminicola]
MARLAKRKKGKTARASRRGLLGISATTIGKKKSKQFQKRSEKRENKQDERKLEDVLRENVSSKKKPVKKRNNLKDFIVNSQYLGVSHLLILTRSELSVNLRIIRNSQGPTLHFKVEKYCLAHDVLAAQKRPTIYEELFKNAPLIVMKGLSSSNERHLQLVQTVFQNMFPEIDVDRVKLGTIKRTLLLHYEPEEDLFELRHYSIKTVPAGVCRSAKKLLKNKVPDLSKYKDISDFMLRPGQLSDSEFEGEQVELELQQDIGGRGAKAGQKAKLRLIEIGPRMTLRLTKIEAGINDGEVLYHAFVEKNVKEIAELRKKAPISRKKRLRLEKRIEHETIRKFRARAEKEAYFAENKDKMEKVMIERQREVTGNYNYDNEDNERIEDFGQEADDELEEKPSSKKVQIKGRRKVIKTKKNTNDNEDTEKDNGIKTEKKHLRKKNGKGNRFK